MAEMAHNGNAANFQKLSQIARELRKTVLKMIHRAQSGHPGGALSAADIITALYFHEMNIRPDDPRWPGRDRFIMSKGHACPIWYAALAKRSYFDPAHLDTLRQFGSILQGHPDMRKTPGVDSTTGSLGNGLSVGMGMALMARLDGRSYRTYVMLGCGELDEGLIWEAAMAAAKFKLGNLMAIIDYNRLQLDGANDEIMPLEPLADKWKAFNWNVISIDGHNFNEILDAFRAARQITGQPTAVIAHTVKGQGVSFMANRVDWHGRAPNDKELETALGEIENGI